MRKCKYCEQVISQAFLDKKAANKSKLIKQAIEERRIQGNRIGRAPISTKQEQEIRYLHANGMSIRKIAIELNISTSPVQRVLK